MSDLCSEQIAYKLKILCRDVTCKRHFNVVVCDKNNTAAFDRWKWQIKKATVFFSLLILSGMVEKANNKKHSHIFCYMEFSCQLCKSFVPVILTPNGFFQHTIALAMCCWTASIQQSRKEDCNWEQKRDCSFFIDCMYSIPIIPGRGSIYFQYVCRFFFKTKISRIKTM